MSSAQPPAEPAIVTGDIDHDDDMAGEAVPTELRCDAHQHDLRTAIERSQGAIDRGESYSAEQVLAELDEILFAP